MNARNPRRGSAVAVPETLPSVAMLPGEPGEYDALYSKSTWGKEYVIEEAPVPGHGFVLEGNAGRSCVPHKPWLLIRHRETHEGLGISLAWSGNWRISIRPAAVGVTEVRALTVADRPEVFDTVGGLPIPGALVSKFRGDWDDGALPITRYVRANLLRPLGDDWPWVQFNTWFDLYQRLDEKRLLALARTAAWLGCEVFVVDAGWYGREEDWSKGIGDWTVNTERLPHGLEPIADEVHRLGMRFGLWFEIECMNPEQPFAKEHADWFLRRAGALVSERGVLDFGKPEVVAWAAGQIERMIERCNLDYTKMDFNTDLGDGGDATPDGTDPLWAHYRGLVGLWKRLRTKYPRLVVENCSSGSLRADLLTASCTDTHWVSDAVENHANLAMNFAMTYLWPPEMCNHWTCVPKPSDAMDLESCFTVSMLGQFGVSAGIHEWDAETLNCAADRIALYSKLRPLIRNAEVYHLTRQSDADRPHELQAVEYLQPKTGEAVLFVFRANDTRSEIVVPLYGLDGRRPYIVIAPKDVAQPKATGVQLMHGLPIRLKETGASAVIRLISANRAAARPLMPVTNLTARVREGFAGDGHRLLELSWSPAADADRYRIWTDDGSNPIVVRDDFHGARLLFAETGTILRTRFAVEPVALCGEMGPRSEWVSAAD